MKKLLLAFILVQAVPVPVLQATPAITSLTLVADWCSG